MSKEKIMANNFNKENLEKITDILNETIRLSSKIYAVDHIFNPEDAGDDIIITTDTADGIHVILQEIASQIGNSLSDAIGLVEKLQREVTA